MKRVIGSFHIEFLHEIVAKKQNGIAVGRWHLDLIQINSYEIQNKQNVAHYNKHNFNVPVQRFLFFRLSWFCELLFGLYV